jgi:LruC domain-containing protein
MLLGIEDLQRDSPSCDHDFNDALFYITTNPVDAPVIANVPKVLPAVDTDGDGINDALDYFPFDPNKAFNNFAPSVASNGSIAYEDLWPSLGDYDFNDLVIDYSFNQIANAQNLITTLEANITIANIGGSYKNGFGIVLPINPAYIKSVTGQVMNSGYITRASNGTETGESKSVIFIVENAQAKPKANIKIVIDFTKGFTPAELGGPPFDPFMVINGDRSREVHLPDMAPTAKGGAMLGTGADYSNAATGRYYKSKRNLPWAINIYSPFAFPPEKVSIDKVYPKFIPWANSGGTLFQDWYK